MLRHVRLPLVTPSVLTTPPHDGDAQNRHGPLIQFNKLRIKAFFTLDASRMDEATSGATRVAFLSPVNARSSYDGAVSH